MTVKAVPSAVGSSTLAGALPETIAIHCYGRQLERSVRFIPKTKRGRTAAAAITAGAVLAGGPLVVSAYAGADDPAQPQIQTADSVGPKSVKAKGAYLLEGENGKGLWGKSADTKREMASTTKVMTASVVVSSGVDLDRKVTVKKAYGDYVKKWGGSTADLKTGDKLTVRQLLYAMLLPSGCDAAYALADTVGHGSTTSKRAESFISMMNKKAAKLGMKNTSYDSFDGISKHDKNYSTPRDMATLGKYALGSKNIRKVVKSSKGVQKATNGRKYTWYNTNQLLGSYKGVIGIKTGTGSKAGPCLLFADEQGGRTVVGVILNSKDRYPDATKMLDWALNKKSTTKVDLRSLPQRAQRD